MGLSYEFLLDFSKIVNSHFKGMGICKLSQCT